MKAIELIKKQMITNVFEILIVAGDKNKDDLFIFAFLFYDGERLTISNHVVDEIDRDEYFQLVANRENANAKVDYEIKREDIIKGKLNGYITKTQIIRDRIVFKGEKSTWDITGDVAICFFTDNGMLMIEAVDSIAGFLKIKSHIPKNYFTKEAVASTWFMKVESEEHLDFWSREIIEI